MVLDDLEKAYEEALKINKIRDNYTFKNLRTIADTMSGENASDMYSDIESIARIIVEKVAMSTACAGKDTDLAKLAAKYLNEAALWADCLEMEKKIYAPVDRD